MEASWKHHGSRLEAFFDQLKLATASADHHALVVVVVYRRYHVKRIVVIENPWIWLAEYFSEHINRVGGVNAASGRKGGERKGTYGGFEKDIDAETDICSVRREDPFV